MSFYETFPASADDVDGISALYKAVAVTPENLSAGEFKESGGMFCVPTEDEILSWVESPDQLVFVTKDSGRVVGYASAILSEDAFKQECGEVFDMRGDLVNPVYLRNVIIAPGSRVKGLTRVLCKEVFEILSDKGTSAALAEIYRVDKIDAEGREISTFGEQDNESGKRAKFGLFPETIGQIQKEITVGDMTVHITSTVFKFRVEVVLWRLDKILEERSI